MSPAKTTATVTAIANMIAGCLSRQELAYWGLILAQLGEMMSSIAALEEIAEASAQGSNAGVEVEAESLTQNAGSATIAGLL